MSSDTDHMSKSCETCGAEDPTGTCCSRTYVVGLPVVVTVSADGKVTVSVDLSEVADLGDVDLDHLGLDEDTVNEDERTIGKAFDAGKITVESDVIGADGVGRAWCSFCSEHITNTMGEWENSEGRYACPAQRDTYHQPRD